MWGPRQFCNASLRRRRRIYYFEKKFVKEVQDAGPARLAELSRTHKGAREMCRDAARFAANLDLKHGLRCSGDGQSIVVPTHNVLRQLFRRERFVVVKNYVTVESTLFCSLGFVVCGADGAPLLVKGVDITADSLAEARAARNKLVAHRPKYVADLVEADAVRDVARAVRAAGASPKPMRGPRVVERRGPSKQMAFLRTLNAILEDTDDQSPIAFSAAAHGIVIQDRPMLMGFIRDRGWTKDSRAFFDQLGKCGFKKQWVRNFGDAYVNPDVASVDAIAGMETMDTKKRKATGTGPATAPKRTRADPS